MPVDISHLRYVPTLQVRPAEMNALQELPDQDKNQILPVVLLGSWVNSHQLSKTTDRLYAAFPGRPWIADLSSSQNEPSVRRPVHDELEGLVDPKNGFGNWCSFIEEQPLAIPCLRLENPSELRDQIRQLQSYDRGLVVRLQRALMPILPQVLSALRRYEQENLVVILEQGQVGRDILSRAAEITQDIRQINEALPGAAIVLSATSFPFSFTNLSFQDIYERIFFQTVKQAIPQVKLVYGDHGSARDETRKGGGIPAPRIDYPLRTEWKFFRSEDNTGEMVAGYKAVAKALKGSRDWDPRLRIWGTQMIERTAAGDPFAISSPARSTAARINIHLHRQLFYDDPDDKMYETDDDWID